MGSNYHIKAPSAAVDCSARCSGASLGLENHLHSIRIRASCQLAGIFRRRTFTLQFYAHRLDIARLLPIFESRLQARSKPSSHNSQLIKVDPHELQQLWDIPFGFGRFAWIDVALLREHGWLLNELRSTEFWTRLFRLLRPSVLMPGMAKLSNQYQNELQLLREK